MLFYITVVDGKPTCHKTFEGAFKLTEEKKDWFVCSCWKGQVVVCGHSIGAFDENRNKNILAQLKRHFAKREGAS